jgi:hypothetical protein
MSALEKEQKGKELKAMSEELVKVSGCGSPKEAEEVRQNAAICNLGEKAKFILRCSIGGIILALASGIFLFGKILELQQHSFESKLRMERVERQLQELEKRK